MRLNSGMPVVRTDGRSVYGHVIAKFSTMCIDFLSYGAPLVYRIDLVIK